MERDASDTTTTPVKEWKIKGKHLVTNNQGGYWKFITLSAKFANYGDLDLNQHPLRMNPYFQPDDRNGPKPSEYIDSIDVEVEYHGHLDASINWIRLETPRAREIFRGKYDSLLQAGIIALNNKIRTENGRDMRIHRFYTQDEPIPSEWASTRYVNKLLSGRGVVEKNIDYYGHFMHATDFDQYWTSATINFITHDPNPFVQWSKIVVNKDWYTLSVPSCFNYGGGYAGIYWHRFTCPSDSSDTTSFDTLNSGYDNYFKIPLDYLNSTNALNCGPIGRILFTEDYYVKYSNMLFSERPWYCFLWVVSSPWYANKREVVSQLSCDSSRSLLLYSWDSSFTLGNSGNGGGRPKTGEEMRAMMWHPVILGAKGLFYWRKEISSRVLTQAGYSGLQTRNARILEQAGQLPSGDTLVYSDLIGGDYIDLNDRDTINSYGWGLFFDQNDYDWNTMGIDSNHIYVGFKSNRAEIRKFHKWIEAVEDTLLDLRLVSWVRRAESKCMKLPCVDIREDPKFIPSTGNPVIKKYILIDNVKTRRLWDPSNMRWFAANEGFDPDSLRFFDLTLYRRVWDTALKSDAFYIGILHPRTDPLVRTIDTVRHLNGGIAYIDSSMKFYSSAEFDKGVQEGGPTHLANDTGYVWRDTSYWQDNWWKRLGCREIHIPFVSLYGPVPACRDFLPDYVYKVTELGANDTDLNEEFWRQSKYYHRVDTTLYGYVGDGFWFKPGYRNYTLKVRLLPGEGKILRVIRYRRPDVATAAFLPFLPQTALITHPITPTGIGNQWRRDSIYHHLVYYRVDSTTGRSRVFYRRSFPLFPDTSGAIPQIEWGPEFCLSDSIRCWREPERIITNTDCANPSIVVRYDSASERTKVYVVFNCRDVDSLANFNDCLFAPRFECDSGNYVVVAENVFNAQDSIQQISPAQALHYACGDDYAKWGVPVINASRYGNYYAWADTVRGIVTAYKTPQSMEFPLGFNFGMSSLRFYDNSLCTNPSLFTYSRIHYNEDGCAVVWQEKELPAGTFNIYYSLLKVDTSRLFVGHRFPEGTRSANPQYLFNSDSSIVRLGLSNEEATNAVIYRSVEDSLLPPGPEQSLDLVAWSARRTDTVPSCDFVRTVTVQHFLNNGNIMATSIKPQVKLLTDYVNYILKKPVVAQGSSGSSEEHQGPMVLELIIDDSCPTQANFERKVLHLPYDFFVTENPYSEIIHTGAKYVQLSKRPFISPQNDWWQNLRLLQKDTTIGLFCSSTRMF